MKHQTLFKEFIAIATFTLILIFLAFIANEKEGL